MRLKYLRKSTEQAQLERQLEEAIIAQQQATTTTDPTIVTFDVDDMGEDT